MMKTLVFQMRKRSVPNPDYKSIFLQWQLDLGQREEVRPGQLKLFFRNPDILGRRRSLSIPCLVTENQCYPIKVKMSGKLIDRWGQPLSEHPYHIIGKQGGTLSEDSMVVNNLIEMIARDISKRLSADKGAIHLEGDMLIPPKTLKIPKRLIVHEVSLDALADEGLL